MIAALLIAAQTVAPPSVVPTPQAIAAVPLPPRDWTTLPLLRLRKPAAALADASSFVRAEVAAGRCAAATRAAQGWSLDIDLAVLVTPAGQVRRITPRAIACPTVEQYAAGVVLGTARANIDPQSAETDAWYRTSMTFTWSE